MESSRASAVEVLCSKCQEAPIAFMSERLCRACHDVNAVNQLVQKATTGKFFKGRENVSLKDLEHEFQISHPRAAAMMEKLHRTGIIGPKNGFRPRRVLSGKAEIRNGEITVLSKQKKTVAPAKITPELLNHAREVLHKRGRPRLLMMQRVLDIPRATARQIFTQLEKEGFLLRGSGKKNRHFILAPTKPSHIKPPTPTEATPTKSTMAETSRTKIDRLQALAEAIGEGESSKFLLSLVGDLQELEKLRSRIKVIQNLKK